MTGLVGNTLVLLVLRRDGLVRTSANVYLSALAVGDSLVLMVALIVWYPVLAWGWWLVDASTLAGYAARPVRDFAFPDTNLHCLQCDLRCDWLLEVNTRDVHLAVRPGRRERRRIKEDTKQNKIKTFRPT